MAIIDITGDNYKTISGKVNKTRQTKQATSQMLVNKSGKAKSSYQVVEQNTNHVESYWKNTEKN